MWICRDAHKIWFPTDFDFVSVQCYFYLAFFSFWGGLDYSVFWNLVAPRIKQRKKAVKCCCILESKICSKWMAAEYLSGALILCWWRRKYCLYLLNKTLKCDDTLQMQRLSLKTMKSVNRLLELQSKSFSLSTRLWAHQQFHIFTVLKLYAKIDAKAFTTFLHVFVSSLTL